MWQIETYNRTTRHWQAYGAPSADFAALYKKITSLQETGNKARLVKVDETPEQKQQEGEAPELLRRAQAAGCTFSAPLACEYCTEKQCPVTVIDMQKLDQEEAK